jgi:ABC-type uncharacterized transport system permease subunit
MRKEVHCKHTQLQGKKQSSDTYPMNIFNGVVRRLLFTVIPAGFISFVPLQLLHQFTWPLLGAMVAFTMLIRNIFVLPNLAAQYCVQRNLRLCDAEDGRKSP